MLSSFGRGAMSAAFAAVLVVGGWQITTAGAALGDPGGCFIDPGSGTRICDVQVGSTTTSEAPSSSSSASTGGGKPVCLFFSIEVPCSGVDGWLWYPKKRCWVGPADTLQSVPPNLGKGWYYKAYCPDVTWTQRDPVGTYQDIFLPDPPPNQPSPIVLAMQAEATITMRPPSIGINPTHDGSGLVGMPVWMWTVQSPETWGTHQSAPQTQAGLSVTATATAKSIVWDMGDGQKVTCANPGTPYAASYGLSASPDCGHTYTQPSGTKPNGVYIVTATTTWQVTWAASDGQAGTLPDQLLTSTTTVKIGEVQAVNG